VGEFERGPAADLQKFADAANHWTDNLAHWPAGPTGALGKIA